MLALTDTQISTWVASFMLPLFRIIALLMTMPIIGTTLVPRRVRMYLAVAITVVVAPALP
ncbi:flagellar biosynthesis protein FliR, partial [Pseudomonas syringae pv. pisi str. 1704B]